MTVAVDLGSDAVKIAGGADSPVLLEHPIDPELAARVGTSVPLIRRDDGLVIMQTPHEAYVRAVATALDGKPADSVAIVAPDWWSKRARDVVEQTLQAHASGPFRLVSPAVSAVSASRERHRLPTTVAVLDIGAESSSSTIVTDVDGVHRVTGRASVLHGQAGNDIDRRLMQHVLGWLSSADHGFEPTDSEIVAAGESLLTQVKAAKERLSTRPAATLSPDLPGANAELRLVRSEFDEVVRGTVDAIVAMLKASIETNAAGEAEAVLLIGGSVSIPLVTQVISVQVGLPVLLDNDPATLAVRGAATMEMPAPPQRRRWRRRRRRAASARNVFDLDNAPTPDSQPVPDSVPNPPEPSPRHRVEPTAADDSDEAAADSEVRETAAGNGAVPRLGGFIERSRREGEAARPELGPVHLVVEEGDAPSSARTVRWTSSPEDSGWDSARHAHVDGEGQFRVRVNDRDYEVDMGAELASTPVTVLLVGLHVFVTASGSGAVLRELRLNPDHDYRPE
jgi:Hsp70 protein